MLVCETEWWTTKIRPGWNTTHVMLGTDYYEGCRYVDTELLLQPGVDCDFCRYWERGSRHGIPFVLD